MSVKAEFLDWWHYSSLASRARSTEELTGKGIIRVRGILFLWGESGIVWRIERISRRALWVNVMEITFRGVLLLWYLDIL